MTTNTKDLDDEFGEITEEQSGMPEDKTKEFSDDQELPTLESGNFLKKELFLEAKTVVIKDIRLNKFGKPVISVETEDKEISGTVAINNSNYNDLKREFGKTKRDIVGNTVTLKAKPFESESRSGEMLRGYQILMSFS